MFFERLADIVIRRRGLILAIWIVALIPSALLAMQVDSVLEYKGLGSRDEVTEPDRVRDIISTDFGESVPNSSALVVLQAWDVRSPAVKGFVYELDAELRAGDRVVFLDNVTSVYSVAEGIIKSTVNLTSSTLYLLQDQGSQLAIMLYLPIDVYWLSWGEVQNASQLIYGIPSLFKMNWDMAQGNITQRDTAANASTVAYLDSMLKNASKDERDLAFGYYYTFFGYWCQNQTNDSRGRALGSIEKAVPDFTNKMSNQTMRDVFLGVWQYFDFDSWADTTKVNGFTYGMVRDILRSSFGSGYDQISVYYDSLIANWNASFSSQPGITPRARADVALNATIPGYIDTQPADMRGFMASVYWWFNISDYMSAAQVDRFVVFYYTGMSGLDPGLVQQTYDLGPNLTDAETSAFARQWVLGRPIEHLGVPVPEGTLTQFISPDNTTMRIVISFTKGSGYIAPDGQNSVSKDIATIRSVIGDTVKKIGIDGIKVIVTGDAAFESDIQKIAGEDLKVIEPVTFIAIVILISIFFYSVATPWLPLGAVGVALAASQAILFLVGFFLFKINYTVLTFLFSVLMAVGTDYAIFLVARFREEMLFGKKKEVAVKNSIVWAGESVATSGGTVLVSFMALAALSTSTIIRAIGLTIGIGVAISIAIALTLVPVILLYAGDRLFWPSSGKRFERSRRKFLKRHKLRQGYFYRAAEHSINHAPVILLICALISIPTTYIIFTEPTSYDFIGAMPGTESSAGLDLMSEGFGKGEIFPTYIVLRTPSPVVSDKNFTMPVIWSVENLSVEMTLIENVKKVTSPTRPFGEPIELAKLADASDQAHDALVSLAMTAIGKDNRTILITIVFKDEPLSQHSLETFHLLSDTARSFAKKDTALESAEVLIGGETASVVDDQARTKGEFANMEILVIVGIFIIMLVVLGSVALAIASILTIAMSISWAFALTLVIFPHMFGMPVLYLVPLILFIILMGIGMDYNVFILTRVREEVTKSGETKKAVARAVERTGGIITALALIMGCALGTLVLSNTGMLKEFGFALFSAILIDAMVVRTYLVPAMIAVLGKRAWWAPGRLQRVKVKK
jgi:RND superfamily putative drug exporter